MDGPDLSRIESADSKMQTPSTMRMGVPRIDTEPMFTALKAAIGESWPEYKTTLSSFFLGKLNQAELSQVTDRLLSYAPSVSYNGALVSTVHLHNKIFGAIHSNIYRDPPPEPVASWVLATDAPASASANKSVSQGGGDKAEERLKREVMALSARDRRRIKSAKDNLAAVPPSGPLHENATYATALTVPITSSQIPDAIPTTATSLSKTNWDLEIRRRYAVPLASETLDFPSRADIQARIEPICYEEGVGLSAVPMTSAALQAIAELVEVATETFIKEKLTAWFSTTRSNAPGDLGPITAKFRAQMRREEEAIDRGQLGRSAAGFLPCEQEALTRREPLSLDEVRMSLRLDDTRLRLDPFLGEEIMGDVEMEMVDTPMALTNGDHHEPLDTKEADGDAMMTDDDDLGGWEGATAADRDSLFSVLDSVLAPERRLVLEWRAPTQLDHLHGQFEHAKSKRPGQWISCYVHGELAATSQKLRPHRGVEFFYHRWVDFFSHRWVDFFYHRWQFLRQRLQATPLNSDATKPLKMALNVRGILALRSNSTTTSKAQDTPSSRSVRFVPLPAHYGKCSRNSAYIWRGATQDNSLTQKSSDVRNHGARADRGNNSRSSSSTLARSIQTFHAFKPRNKLADTDEIESPLLG
ncbi:putative transcriptional co-activator [Aureobasidium pullulans]|nr:putative transcriptional co-activator [Aureobasidium pullulans]